MTKEINKLQSSVKAAWRYKNFPEFRRLSNELAHLLFEVKHQMLCAK
jgi:hypothetical protein